jgi:subtilisin family serine protease
MVNRLSGRPGIAYAEPNYIQWADAIPDDPDFGQLWGLDNTTQTGGTDDADIDGPEAWDIATGSQSIVVGVIDTGVDYNHEDLAANMWKNPGEIEGNGIDDDGNGFVDDIYGWDFYNGDSDPFDDAGHGSHCSGTIGAVGNNGVGVAGVNWNVEIMALKFLGAGGSGPTSAAVEAVEYATMMRRDHGVNVVLTSNSWGGGGASQALEDAIADCGTENIMFVAAAGNSGSDNDATPYYPATYPQDNIIAVAATDHNDAKASFSSYGLETVDLAAPGVDVYSTLPGNGYGTKSGTSMATPHVAGVAALAWSLAPSAPFADVKAAIVDGTDPVDSMSGITVSGGRLNARSTLGLVGMAVGSSTPAAGEVLVLSSTSLPTEFVVNFSHPVDSSSLELTDLDPRGTPQLQVQRPRCRLPNLGGQ